MVTAAIHTRRSRQRSIRRGHNTYKARSRDHLPPKSTWPPTIRWTGHQRHEATSACEEDHDANGTLPQSPTVRHRRIEYEQDAPRGTGDAPTWVGTRHREEGDQRTMTGTPLPPHTTHPYSRPRSGWEDLRAGRDESTQTATTQARHNGRRSVQRGHDACRLPTRDHSSFGAYRRKLAPSWSYTTCGAGHKYLETSHATGGGSGMGDTSSWSSKTCSREAGTKTWSERSARR